MQIELLLTFITVEETPALLNPEYNSSHEIIPSPLSSNLWNNLISASLFDIEFIGDLYSLHKVINSERLGDLNTIHLFKYNSVFTMLEKFTYILGKNTLRSSFRVILRSDKVRE